ncbi:MAG: hypothetical protein MJ228_03550 [Bacilli bacterium]|nr:hypothetical protein [Bacilli bacterium]
MKKKKGLFNFLRALALILLFFSTTIITFGAFGITTAVYDNLKGAAVTDSYILDLSEYDLVNNDLDKKIYFYGAKFYNERHIVTDNDKEPEDDIIAFPEQWTHAGYPLRGDGSYLFAIKGLAPGKTYTFDIASAIPAFQIFYSFDNMETWTKLFSRGDVKETVFTSGIEVRQEGTSDLVAKEGILYMVMEVGYNVSGGFANYIHLTDHPNIEGQMVRHYIYGSIVGMAITNALFAFFLFFKDPKGEMAKPMLVLSILVTLIFVFSPDLGGTLWGFSTVRVIQPQWYLTIVLMLGMSASFFIMLLLETNRKMKFQSYEKFMMYSAYIISALFSVFLSSTEFAIFAYAPYLLVVIHFLGRHFMSSRFKPKFSSVTLFFLWSVIIALQLCLAGEYSNLFNRYGLHYMYSVPLESMILLLLSFQFIWIGDKKKEATLLGTRSESVREEARKRDLMLEGHYLLHNSLSVLEDDYEISNQRGDFTHESISKNLRAIVDAEWVNELSLEKEATSIDYLVRLENRLDNAEREVFFDVEAEGVLVSPLSLYSLVKYLFHRKGAPKDGYLVISVKKGTDKPFFTYSGTLFPDVPEHELRKRMERARPFYKKEEATDVQP